MLLPKVTKLLLVLPATNTTSERSFSAMERIKTYLRSTTSGNRLNHCMSLYVHCMLLYVQCKKTDQLNTIETAKEFVGDNQARLQTFTRV